MAENATMIPAGAKQGEVTALVQQLQRKNLPPAQRYITVEKIVRLNADKIFSALPKHVSRDRMVRVLLFAIRKNPKLQQCEIASLLGAMSEAATYGWEIGGVLGHAYLVPYKAECQLIPGYKGLIDLCRRSGQVSTISLEVVHKGDKFEYSLGDDPKIVHVPNDRDPKRDEKPIEYVYAVVKLRDGGVQRSVWSAEKVNAHKEQYSQGWRHAESGDRSKGGSKKDSPWHTAWPTMAKKTVIRDMINRGLVPLSPEFRDMANRAVIHDADENLELGDAGTFDVVPTSIEDETVSGNLEGEIAGDSTEAETGDEGNQDSGADDEARTVQNFKGEIAKLTDDQAIAFELEQVLLQYPDLSDESKSQLRAAADERREWLAKTGAKADAKSKGGKQRDLVK